MRDLSPENMRFFHEIDKSFFNLKFSETNIQKERKDLLFDVITRQLDVDTETYICLVHYAYKIIFGKENYNNNLHSLPENLLSKNELYEYDTPKNGQNIVKHGFSFGSLMSYHKNFGKLTIILDNINGEARNIVFSSIELPENKNNYQGLYIKGKISSMTITKQKENRFRIISSMRLSRKEENWKRQIATATKIDHYTETQKKDFLKDCYTILKR